MSDLSIVVEDALEGGIAGDWLGGVHGSRGGQSVSFPLPRCFSTDIILMNFLIDHP